MRCVLKATFGVAVLLSSLTAPVVAGPLEDGAEAYQGGDYATALRMWRPLADQGNARAQFNLGRMYANGDGVPVNYAEAVRWYRKSAVQGTVVAQVNLGGIYARGNGVPQDYILAYMWTNLAAAQDSRRAESREAVASHLTSKQLAQAQSMAERCLRSNYTDCEPRASQVVRPNESKGAPSPTARNVASTGTGFFVSKDGAVLTNAHVVEKCNEIRVDVGHQQHAARLVARDEKNDLALLSSNTSPAQWANLRLSVRQGDDVVVYGFPLAGLLATGGNVVTGNITALSGIANDSRLLQISNPVQPGNSGGPLLDRSGNVVGVVVSKLNALNIAAATGDIPQNVNFAIKASVAAAFLDAQQVAYTEGKTDAPLSTPDLSERAKAWTVRVICSR